MNGYDTSDNKKLIESTNINGLRVEIPETKTFYIIAIICMVCCAFFGAIGWITTFGKHYDDSFEFVPPMFTLVGIYSAIAIRNKYYGIYYGEDEDHFETKTEFFHLKRNIKFDDIVKWSYAEPVFSETDYRLRIKSKDGKRVAIDTKIFHPNTLIEYLYIKEQEGRFTKDESKRKQRTQQLSGLLATNQQTRVNEIFQQK